MRYSSLALGQLVQELAREGLEWFVRRVGHVHPDPHLLRLLLHDRPAIGGGAAEEIPAHLACEHRPEIHAEDVAFLAPDGAA